MSAVASLEVRGLAKTFREGWRGKRSIKAVDGVDLDLKPGEVYGFLGPNGAGKSTFLYCALNLLRPSAGSVRLLGEAMHPGLMRRIGFVPEECSLHQAFTGRRLLTDYGRLHGMTREAAGARAVQLLEQLELGDAADRKIARYSKGMRQRLSVAQALLHDPDLIFLDEPTRGLDPVGVRILRDLIRDLAAAGKTVFFNSHVLSEVEMVATRVGILIGGRLKWEGRPLDIPGAGDRHAVIFRLPPGGTLEGFAPKPLAEGEPIHSVTTATQEELFRCIEALRNAGGALLEVTRLRLLEDFFIELVDRHDA